MVINSAIYGGDKTSHINGFSHDFLHPDNLKAFNNLITSAQSFDKVE